ncbi:hypothetical protein MYOV003v1_p0027 [Vibrio phage 207E48.1]|nr:hypothetical protein MYOV003v1_p0027 [Vibrio phage 207E48.1]
MDISDKVIVGEVDMHVHACSRIGPVHLMNCRITCEFNLYRPLRENEVLTLIRDSFSDKTP